jgi:putative ABC transport system permease protein
LSASAKPPLLACVLLRAVVPREARDAIEGDLHEIYVARRAASGAAAAALWYWLETLSFALRFSLDGFVRAIRSLFTVNAAPSVLDMKLGGRMLAKSPGLAIVGGFGMAVAVALGAGGYAVVNSYFYPDVPLQEGDRIVALGKFDRQRFVQDDRVLADFLVWRRELRSVVDVAAFRTIGRNLMSESGVGEPVTLAEMSAAGFRVARVPALRGRTLTDADEQPSAVPVVVIGYDVWQTRFAGDVSIVGRQIRIGRDVHTIVGVMPPDFSFPVNHQYWVPLRIDPRAPVTPGTGPDLDVFGRLAKGATKESAQAELSVIGQRLAAQAPPELARLESRVIPYTDIFLRAEAGDNVSMRVLRFLIALLLVVVATNVAVLVYARTVTRTEEIAVRTALGATRGRIVGQLFAEALVLSGLSALAGLGLVAVGLRMFDRALDDWFQGHPPFWIHAGISTGTVLYAVALAVIAALIVGVFPALRATGSHLRAAIGSLGSGAKARLGPTWTALIVAQIAITVAFLPPALFKGTLTIKTAMNKQEFARGEYLTTGIQVERDAQATTLRADSAALERARAIVAALVARLTLEPGVVGTTITSTSPLGGNAAPMEVEGSAALPERAGVRVVDANYFDLFGVRLVAGRTFAAADIAIDPRTRPVIVNRSFATELLRAGDPIGQRIRYRGYGDEVQPWLTIVGVVEDFPAARDNPGLPSARAMFHLAAPGEMTNAVLTVRVRGQKPELFTPALRRVAASIDPMLQLTQTTTLDAQFRENARGVSRLAILIALITLSVLLLSAAGIHALMSFTVNQRRREIGIRKALGAPGRRIATSVLGRALRQLGFGVVVGLTIAVGGNQLSRGELMGDSGFLLVPGTAVFMLVVGLLAAAAPVRRGLRVQPTEALRGE